MVKKRLVLLWALLLALSLGGCGGGGKSDDPNVGIWNGISVSMLGIDMDIAEVFDNGVTLELKANGKFTLDVDGDKGSGKWEYDGKGISFSSSDAQMHGTFEGDMLKLNNLLDSGMDMAFEKEGSGGEKAKTDKPAEEKSSGDKPKLGAKGGDAGYYEVESLTDGEMVIEKDMLIELELNWYIVLNEDGSADVVFDELIEGTWKKGAIDLGDEGVLDYTLKGDEMTIEIDGETMVLLRSDKEPPKLPQNLPAASKADKTRGEDPVFDTDMTALQEWWSGDWYGYWEVSGASGVYKDWEEIGYMDCYARIELDEDGMGRVWLWDDSGEMGTVDIEASEIGGSGSMGAAISTGGSFMDYPIGRADWLIDPSLYGHDDYMVIDGDFENPDDPDSSFYYYCYLRPWGYLWDDFDDDERPPCYDWYLENYEWYMLDAIYYSDDSGGFIHPDLD
ncbi:hypothetical protein LJB89_02835 [Tyzzerella sp. OttesenSCG-928-J15]|nr:hypothetical protein [Tyzzerella sp. OttesenSCG-928-J15]